MKSTLLVLAVESFRADDTYIVFDGQLENFSEGVYGILTADRISFHISNVIVCCEQNPNSVLGVWQGISFIAVSIGTSSNLAH